jgi:hypothetical protein
MGNEYLTYRFGFMAVKKGFATPEQVSKALEVQFNENVAAKKHRLIGEILLDRGAMNASQVNKVLESMSNNNPLL